MEYFFYKTINLKSKLSVIYRYEYYIYIQRDEMSFVSKNAPLETLHSLISRNRNTRRSDDLTNL